MTPEVVCLGIVVADVVCRPVEALPPRGTLARVDEMSLHGGGCALNTATVLSRLGRHVAVAGKIGTDPFGTFLEALAARRGLDTSALIRDPECPTSATVVLVDAEGERTFLHCAGANDQLHAGDIDLELISRTRALHVAGSFLMSSLDGEPTAEILASARRNGVVTSLDTAFDPTEQWFRLQSCLPHVDILCASLPEAAGVSGSDNPERAAQWLRQRGVSNVAIKLGADGCYAHADDFVGHVGAHAVDVVDGTGAGDAFVAGLLHGHLAGWSFETSVRFANAAGALSTTSTGATDGLRSAAAVEALLENAA